MPRVEKITTHQTPPLSFNSSRSRSGSLSRGEMTALPKSLDSVVTVGASRCFLGDDGTAASTGHSSEWTNEKHCLYIGSLERSFLDQLQQYKLLSGDGRTRDTPFSLLEMPSSNEVLPRTKLHRDQPFDSLQKNRKKVCVTRKATSPSGLEGPSMKQPVGSMTEYSDQNFVEQYEEEPKYAPFSKRLKKSKVDASANDQVVPTAGNRNPLLHGIRSFKRERILLKQELQR